MSSNTQSLAEVFYKLMIWEKGHPVPGYDPREWRRDDFGALIRYSDHGDRNSPFGWEMDHIRPQALLGRSDVGNMRPLHCSRNASLGGILGGLLNNR